MRVRSFSDSSNSYLPAIDDIFYPIRLKQWLRSSNRNARDLSTHSALASSMGSPYYGGRLVLNIRTSNLHNAPLLVLSDAELARRQSEVDRPCKRCAAWKSTWGC